MQNSAPAPLFAKSSALQSLQRLPAWLMVGVALLLVLVALVWISRPFSSPNTVLISTAQARLLDPKRPDTAKTVTLPHIWDDEQPPWDGTARYQLQFPAATTLNSKTDVPQALYLSRVGARFRVWLGDRLIHSEHWHTQGYVDTSVQPYLILLPAELSAKTLAELGISIEVRGQLLRKSGISGVVFGPEQVLRERFERVMLRQVQATWMVAACSLLMAMLCALMWLHNQDKIFGLLAAASAAWAVRLMLTPMVHTGLSFEVWFFAHKVSFAVYCGFLYLFLWELFNFQQKTARRLVITLMCVSPFWLALTTWTQMYVLYRIWSAAITSVSVITLLLMFHRARWGLDASQRLMIVVGLVTMITGVRDFAVVQLNMPGDGDIRWMTLGSLVFMLTLAWIMAKRTARYMQHMGDLNVQLEQRVTQREAQLKQAFDSLREAEHRQVLEAERARLTRDMHDGLGSQLVQTLNLVRSQGAQAINTPQLEAMLSHALEELRMTLDSLEPMEGDLPTILGTLRQRLSPTLEAAGIELEWQVQEVPPIAVNGLPMESRAVMQLFRALQEIFANIIKHAKAKNVLVKTWSETTPAPAVFLSVCDDGVGIGVNSGAGQRDGGRGMDNLRSRASALGATLSVNDLSDDASRAADQPGNPCHYSNGTCVSLRFETVKFASTSSPG